MENNLLIPNEEGRTPDMVIQKASNIACVLQCGGIWMANGNFGVSWKLFQGKYKENVQLEVGKGVCHVPMSQEDSAKMAETSSSGGENVSASNTGGTMVESDDEEEDADVDSGEAVEENKVDPPAEEEGSPVEQKPKKKRVVKKKASAN